jgi:hypothetical protein
MMEADMTFPRRFRTGLRILAASLWLAMATLIPASPLMTAQKAKPAQDPIARLQALQPRDARARILVLGTFHLRQIEKTFQPGMLDGLVAVLEKFRPEAICIETMPGARVREYELRREAGPLYGEVLDGFAERHLRLGRRACALLGTTQEAARKKALEMLRAARAGTGQPSLSVETRASLTLWMLAAYDPSSALLQWSYLSDADKRSQKAIPADLIAQLEAEAGKVNEGPALAVRLGLRLGLDRLEPVDDFEEFDDYSEFIDLMEKKFEGHPMLAAASKAPVYADSTARLEECLRKGDLLPQYDFLNSPAYAAGDVEAQWGVFLRTHMPGGTDRGRLGLWENRNLKIAARIRAVAARHPGGRILVIYGAAHKPFLDAYLGQASDIEIVQFSELDQR